MDPTPFVPEGGRCCWAATSSGMLGPTEKLLTGNSPWLQGRDSISMHISINMLEGNKVYELGSIDGAHSIGDYSGQGEKGRGSEHAVRGQCESIT